MIGRRTAASAQLLKNISSDCVFAMMWSYICKSSPALAPIILITLMSIIGRSASFQSSPPTQVQQYQITRPTIHFNPLFATKDDSSSSSSDTTTTTTTTSSSSRDINAERKEALGLQSGGPDILQPYLPAMDPNYATTGPIGNGNFIISRDGGPTIDELGNDQMLSIVRSECTDLEVNTLVWKCLGYRLNFSSSSSNNNNNSVVDSDDETKNNSGVGEGEEECEWTPSEVFPKWKERYPTPPDFINMKRVYSREVDQDSLKSNQALVRSIPMEFKQSLKGALKPLGWKGYKVRYSFVI